MFIFIFIQKCVLKNVAQNLLVKFEIHAALNLTIGFRATLFKIT